MDIYRKSESETVDSFLWRVGCLKEQGICGLTWPELTVILNSYMSDPDITYSESYWRKRFRAMRTEKDMDQFQTSAEETDLTDASAVRDYLLEIEKQRIRTRDERVSVGRILREDARQDGMLDMIRSSIERVQPYPVQTVEDSTDAVIYAMQSDIHFGMTYDNYIGRYNSNIAAQRVMRYAAEIIRLGEQHRAKTCYVSIMGDLISGSIHSTIRIENKENLIEQVIGVSELVSNFLHHLSSEFETVIVNSVSGNHSRIEHNAEDALRAEKLDALIPWYCKARLENCTNISFVDNVYDSSIGSFMINGYHFISVHGDMDNDLKLSAQRIEQMIDKRIDYVLAGHLHVPETRIESVGYIRNGSVCGSGDEYTVKKRLFSPPSQVCLIVTDRGVECICPVMLDGR